MKSSKKQRAAQATKNPNLKPSPVSKTGKHRGLVVGALTTLGVVSLGIGSGLLGHARADKAGVPTIDTPQQPTEAAQTASATAADVPYTPSKFPGVMVRNVPSPAGAETAKTGKGWIYVKPGAKKPHFGSPYGVRGGGIWYEPGKTAAGGTAAHVDRNFYPYVTAKIKRGKVALECIDGHNTTHHESISNGNTHTTQPATSLSMAARHQAQAKPAHPAHDQVEVKY